MRRDHRIRAVGLGHDRGVCRHAFLQEMHGAYAALQFPNDKRQQHFPWQPVTGEPHCFRCGNHGGVGALHVHDACAVQTIPFHHRLPGIVFPSERKRIDVEVTIQHQRLAAACPA